MTRDSLLAALLVVLIWAAVMGPMLFMLWLRLRKFIAAMIALRDRIDRSQRH